MLTFEQVDQLFKSYGLVAHKIKQGQCWEYEFSNRFLGRKRNVATQVKELLNGGVGGYIYVDHLSEFINHPKKTKMGHLKIGEMTLDTLRVLLEKVIVHYK